MPVLVSSMGKHETEKWQMEEEAGSSQARLSLSPYPLLLCAETLGEEERKGSQVLGIMVWPQFVAVQVQVLSCSQGGTVGWGLAGGRGPGKCHAQCGAMLQIQEKPRTLSRHDAATHRSGTQGPQFCLGRK